MVFPKELSIKKYLNLKDLNFIVLNMIANKIT